ncbi:histidinol phosphate aminotransferase [Wenyingzhuangia fucanilytica]|uniref:Histidinol-phosphate aminotransferase n=1 Tax=Wenyingzhuangia fucanilytica TaxID=1790137 RepID=A0A1B1Y452_9FLAO|nr:histidinol-phosphate transaminase [Wenyingzhuangia fucanilytica]ANW95546.1 histidinol phosphate aminotransferase [Wenyingzhuangia fucanilytica]
MSFNLNKIVRENVANMKAYSSARDEFTGATNDMVFLDANENPFENGVNRYPDPMQKTVKSELAKIKEVAQENILLGNGSDEVIDLILRAFCEPKEDNIITLPPSYGMYDVSANLNNISIKEVPLKENFQPNVAKILETVDANTKVIFLCSPNNPSGNLFDYANVKAIVEGFNGLVVVDEAYIDFASEPSWVARLEKHPNLIVSQTMSKAFGMAGIRLGVCYASVEIIAVLNKIKPPYNVNELTQQKALERLLAYEDVQEEIEAVLVERDNLEIALKEISFVEKIYPSDANFLLVKVDDATKRYTQLIEKGIVVRNRTTQALCENTLRFTVGTIKENVALMKALKELE